MTGLELIQHFKTFNGRGRTYNAYGEHLVIPVKIGEKLTSISVTEQSYTYWVWGPPKKGSRSFLAQVHFTGKVTKGETELAEVNFR